MSARRWMYSVAVVIPLALLVYYVWPRTLAPKTRLQIEITGGFAYVPPTPGDNHLNIAYLNDWVHNEDITGDGVPDEVCNVPQVGTELKLTRGDIVSWEPSSKPLPPSREFDLDKAVVRFPAVEAANQALTIDRDPWTGPPPGPGDPDNPDHWKNLKWVPGLKEYHAGTTIHPDWPKMVNGRVELRGGEITATTPSNPVFKKAKFDFREGAVSKHKVSVTDKTIYGIELPTASLPDGNIELVLTDAASGFTKLVIKPQGNKVEFTLRGLHAMGGMLGDGEPLKDFCTFYQLLQPMPPATKFLVPYYIKATMPPGSGYGAPSPGFFCNGDWF